MNKLIEILKSLLVSVASAVIVKLITEKIVKQFKKIIKLRKRGSKNQFAIAGFLKYVVLPFLHGLVYVMLVGMIAVVIIKTGQIYSREPDYLFYWLVCVVAMTAAILPSLRMYFKNARESGLYIWK